MRCWAYLVSCAASLAASVVSSTRASVRLAAESVVALTWDSADSTLARVLELGWLVPGVLTVGPVGARGVPPVLELLPPLLPLF